MKIVDGIYDGDQQLMLLATLTKAKPMMGAIFLFGVASGLRVSDVLTVTYGQLGSQMSVMEQKTGKTKHFTLDGQQLEFLQTYAAMAGRTKPEMKLFPTSRTTVYRWFKLTGDKLGLDLIIGTHTMRKTHLHNVFVLSNGCLLTTKAAGNHAFVSTTVSYIQRGLRHIMTKYRDEHKDGITVSMPKNP
jgi:integrase